MQGEQADGLNQSSGDTEQLNPGPFQEAAPDSNDAAVQLGIAADGLRPPLNSSIVMRTGRKP